MENRLPKAQAMAAPTRPPPDTTTSYTVSAGAPAHRRQETSGLLPAAAGAAPNLLTANRADMMLTCALLRTPPSVARLEQSPPITCRLSHAGSEQELERAKRIDQSENDPCLLGQDGLEAPWVGDSIVQQPGSQSEPKARKGRNLAGVVSVATAVTASVTDASVPAPLRR